MMKLSTKNVFLAIILIISSFSNSVYPQGKNANDSTIKILSNIKDASAQLEKTGNVKAAIDTLNYALKLYKENNISNENVLFGIYVDLSNLYGAEAIRDSETSNLFVEKAKALIDKGHDLNDLDVVNFYISQGANYNEEYKTDLALGYITKAYDYFKTNENEIKSNIGTIETKSYEVYLLEWFVSLYMGLDAEEDMIEAFEDVENFWIKNRSIVEVEEYYGMASFRVGRYYQADNAEKASYYFDKADKYGVENVRLYANICKGFAFLSAKQYENIPKVLKVLDEFKNLNKFQELNIHEIAGRLYSEKFDQDKLVYHSNHAINLLNAKDTKIDVLNFKPEDFEPIEELKYPILLNQFAYFLDTTDSPVLNGAATKLFKLSLEQYSNRIDRTPISNTNHTKNLGIIKNRMLHYISGNEISINEKREILSHFENIENRANLNSLIKNRSIANNQSALDNYLKTEKEIRDEITSLKQKQEDQDTLFRKELSKLEVDLAEIEDKIKAENPSFYKLNTTKFNFENLSVSDSTSVVLFDEADGELFRTLVTSTNIITKPLGNYAKTEEEIKDFLAAIKSPKDFEIFNNKSEKLYDLLMSDIETNSNLIIKGDESLLNIPFELLKTDDTYLIEKSSISYTKGLFYLDESIFQNDFAYEANAKFYAPAYENFIPAETELAVRGEPYDLEGAQEEVKAISELIGGEVFDQNEATKTNFFKTANNSSILHIAGHAFLNNNDPELSYIALSDSEEENKLFISELYALKSNANLAVLSACNTGVGGFESGEGIVSLSEAFTYSGIPSTLSSLWSAPDQATKTIMVSFYEHLKDGNPKSIALQKAKKNYLKNTTSPKLKHPYYWAGFVLYGDDSPINIQQNSLEWYYFLIIFVVIVVVSILIFKKRKAA